MPSKNSPPPNSLSFKYLDKSGKYVLAPTLRTAPSLVLLINSKWGFNTYPLYPLSENAILDPFPSTKVFLLFILSEIFSKSSELSNSI